MMMKYLEDALSSCESLVMKPAAADAVEWMSACQTVGSILSGMGFIEESYSWQTMALAMEPNPVNFYLATGRVYGYCQNWEKAAYFCEQIIQRQPDDPQAYCRLAKIYHEMGDYKAEGETIHALLSKQPDKTNAEGHYQLGKVMESHGLLPQAMRCYRQAVEQDPEFVIAYYTLSDLLINQGDAQAAIMLLQQLTEQLEEDAMAHYRLGRAYKQNQQYETAILSFRQALKLDPDLHWAYMGLLNSLLQLQRWDETIESCRGIIHFVGEFPWAYCFLGNALAKKGALLEAAKTHQRAFELRGWERCVQQDYRFTHTWFSENISLWERYLLPLRSPDSESNAIAGTGGPLRILSLGSSDGSSLCWLVDEILRQRDDRLVCMTEGASNQLSENLAKLPEAEKVSVETGDLHALLASLSAAAVSGSDNSQSDNSESDSNRPDNSSNGNSDKCNSDSSEFDNRESDNSFDVIYIQSDRKQADYLKGLATEAWTLLKPNGLMFFKDYQWRDPKAPSQSSKLGVDAFIEACVGWDNVLHQSHQVIVKKEGELSA